MFVWLYCRFIDRNVQIHPWSRSRLWSWLVRWLILSVDFPGSHNSLGTSAATVWPQKLYTLLKNTFQHSIYKITMYYWNFSLRTIILWYLYNTPPYNIHILLVLEWTFLMLHGIYYSTFLYSQKPWTHRVFPSANLAHGATLDKQWEASSFSTVF